MFQVMWTQTTKALVPSCSASIKFSWSSFFPPSPERLAELIVGCPDQFFQHDTAKARNFRQSVTGKNYLSLDCLLQASLHCEVKKNIYIYRGGGGKENHIPISIPSEHIVYVQCKVYTLKV